MSGLHGESNVRGGYFIGVVERRCGRSALILEPYEIRRCSRSRRPAESRLSRAVADSNKICWTSRRSGGGRRESLVAAGREIISGVLRLNAIGIQRGRRQVRNVNGVSRNQ